MEIKYLVESKEQYEHPNFHLETSDRLEALIKASLVFKKMKYEDSVIITEWNDGVRNDNGTLIFERDNGIEPIDNEIKKENDKVLFIVLLGSQYEDTSKGNKVLVSSDRQRVFNVAKELLNNEKDDTYREKQVFISAVKDIKTIAEKRFTYDNKEALKDFAAEFNVDIDMSEAKRMRSKM